MPTHRGIARCLSLVAFFCVLFALAPRAAHACSRCGLDDEGNWECNFSVFEFCLVLDDDDCAEFGCGEAASLKAPAPASLKGAGTLMASPLKLASSQRCPTAKGESLARWSTGLQVVTLKARS
jgi:hypothetical protein